MKKIFLSCFLIAGLAVVPGTAHAAVQDHAALGGIWVLDRDKSAPPGANNLPDAGDRRDGGDRRGGVGGGRRGGGRGGFGGGGFGGGGGGRGGDAGGRDPERMQAAATYLRTIMAASERLTIVVQDASVSIVEANGTRLMLETDNKKVDERAANGLVKLSRKAHWDGATLVSEIDIDNGPKIERKYELSPGGSELRISSAVKGGFGGRGGGGGRTITQVYGRPEEPAP